ncbi:cytochrome p450 [Trifolium pratense]|uniref:Cytochrome p450 n=1 Tax=Trifolium pratense TaxID=57577 RepID=A0A2K3LDM9_TRIPR|nr:cytochrome p450 [Trifolium pratense]
MPLKVPPVESFRLQREEEIENLVKDTTMSEGSPINISEMVDSLAYGLRTAVGAQIESKEKYRLRMLTFERKMFYGLELFSFKHEVSGEVVVGFEGQFGSEDSYSPKTEEGSWDCALWIAGEARLYVGSYLFLCL